MPSEIQLNLQSISNRNKIVFVCAVIAIAVSLIVLAGWMLNISFLKTVVPGFPEMKPNTALAFAVAGAALFFISKYKPGEKWSKASVFCGILVFLIGSLAICEYIAGSDVGIDTFLFSASRMAPGTQFPGRMSPHAALNFTLLGISLILLNGGRRLRKLSEFLAILLSITTFTSVIAFMYGAEELYGFSRVTSIAMHTAVLFIICSCGLLTANFSSETGKLLTSDSLGGVAARRLIPAVVFVPLAIDWLRIQGQEHGLFDAGFGSALMQFTQVMVMGWIILFFSRAAHKTDIRRKRLESELIENEQRFHDLFDYSQGMICIHDLDGVLLTVNPATVRSLGYESDELVGKNLAEFLPVEHRSGIGAFLREIVNEGLSKGLLPVVTKSGQQVMWKYDSVLVSEPEKEPYIIGHAQDVTELIEAQKQLKNLSLTDDLTGLYNRRGFLTMAEQQIKLERHERTARGLTLMFADIDGLKKINDTFGHETGSDAIIQLSTILASVLRDADLVSRWGGDEFVMLTIGSHDEHAEIMTKRINEAIRRYNTVNGKPYHLACSIGVAPMLLDGTQSFESIIANADEAMYAEKRKRKAAGERFDLPLFDSTIPPIIGKTSSPATGQQL